MNQQSEPILERDTIAFVGDFQGMVYLLTIHGELFEGVANHTTTDGMTKVEAVQFVVDYYSGL